MTETNESTTDEPQTDWSTVIGILEGAYGEETVVGDAFCSPRGKSLEAITVDEWQEFLDAVHIFIDKEICQEEA